MKVKNNYDECLTNLACSIRKYFELDYNHKTINYIDKLLEKENPKNVILILLDGMGSKILNKHLDKDSFFIKNKYKDITTVFPATTTAATTSIRTGLNPVEHGWLGWNMYIKSIDKIITLFRDREKNKNEVSNEFLSIKYKLNRNLISDEINNKGKYKAYELFPFENDNAIVYKDLDDMLDKTLNLSKTDEKKYIYLYNDEPDYTMHQFGNDSKEANILIKERNDKIEEFCNKLDDSIVFIIADHGHINVDNLFLNNYPEIMNMLDRNISIEQRACSFKVKEEYKNDFEEIFNKNLGKYFDLYTKEEIINSKLFGDGKEHELFDEALGDYIAIAENSNKCLLEEGDDILKSHHAGYTDDEVYIPLIIIKK